MTHSEHLTNQMKQLTIRIKDPELERRIDQLAREEGTSLNQAALRILRKGAGIEAERSTRGIGNALDSFFGTWTEEQAREIAAAVRIFESIDEAFWR